jgi:hypothetical protein
VRDPLSVCLANDDVSVRDGNNHRQRQVFSA